MKKRPLRIILLALFALCCVAVGPRFVRRCVQELGEHVTWRYIPLGRLPASDGVPRLFLDTDTGLMVKNKEKYAWGSFAWYVDGSLVEEGKVELKGHGNTTWKPMKKAYILKFPEPVAFLGLPAGRKWILLNPYFDKSLMRNDWAYHISRTILDNLGWTPHLIDVEVVMNGRFLGVYQLAEKIDLTPGRIDVAPGGVVMEFKKDDKLSFFTSQGVRMLPKDPNKQVPEATLRHWKEVVDRFEEELYRPDFGEYRKYLDVPSFIDWYLINEFSKNHDPAYGGSTYWVYDPADGMLHFGPVWDFDIACGNIDYDDCEKTEGFWVKDRFVYARRLFEDPSFVQEVKDRWNEIKGPFMEETRSFIAGRRVALADAAAWNYRAWKTLDVDIWPHASWLGNTWDGQVDALLAWIEERYRWFDAAMAEL